MHLFDTHDDSKLKLFHQIMIRMCQNITEQFGCSVCCIEVDIIDDSYHLLPYF